MLTWYTKVSAKFLAVFFSNRLPRQTENFRICLSILLPTYLVPEFQRLQLWNSMPSCVCMYVFFFVFVFKKPLKYFPFYSPILLTLSFWYLKTHIQKQSCMYCPPTQPFFETSHKTTKFKEKPQVKKMMKTSKELWKYIFRQPGDLNFKNFPFSAHHGGTLQW